MEIPDDFPEEEENINKNKGNNKNSSNKFNPY